MNEERGQADIDRIYRELPLEKIPWNVEEPPQTLVALEGKQAESMLRLMDKMEDCDDVQNVYSNFDISAEEMEKMM